MYKAIKTKIKFTCYYWSFQKIEFEIVSKSKLLAFLFKDPFARSFWARSIFIFPAYRTTAVALFLACCRAWWTMVRRSLYNRGARCICCLQSAMILGFVLKHTNKTSNRGSGSIEKCMLPRLNCFCLPGTRCMVRNRARHDFIFVVAMYSIKLEARPAQPYGPWINPNIP